MKLQAKALSIKHQKNLSRALEDAGKVSAANHV